MSDLIVIGYDDPFKAEETRLKLAKMQKGYLIDLEDAVVAVKDRDGKIRLNQAYPLTQMGAVGGGFWGALIGMLFLNPLLGAAVGAGAPHIGDRSREVGIGVRPVRAALAAGRLVVHIPVRRRRTRCRARRQSGQEKCADCRD